MTLNDPGGLIYTHGIMAEIIAVFGIPVRVVYCASACLFILAGVPKDQVCFTRSAWIGYHVVLDANGNEAPSTMRWERGNDWIGRGYKPC